MSITFVVALLRDTNACGKKKEKNEFSFHGYRVDELHDEMGYEK